MQALEREVNVVFIVDQVGGTSRWEGRPSTAPSINANLCKRRAAERGSIGGPNRCYGSAPADPRRIMLHARSSSTHGSSLRIAAALRAARPHLLAAVRSKPAAKRRASPADEIRGTDDRRRSANSSRPKTTKQAERRRPDVRGEVIANISVEEPLDAKAAALVLDAPPPLPSQELGREGIP